VGETTSTVTLADLLNTNDNKFHLDLQDFYATFAGLELTIHVCCLLVDVPHG
jgi:hypothetical protein